MRLATRLHEFQLLPEENRKNFIDVVSNYALNGEDAFALDNEEIRTLFTVDEFKEFVRKIRTELLPRLWDVRHRWESNHSPDDLPEEYMQKLLEFFDSLKKHFSDDEDTIIHIDHQIACTNDWIYERTPEEPEITHRNLGRIEIPDQQPNKRSIFDDIDKDDGNGF